MRIKLMTLCMALCCLCLNAFAQNVPDYVPTEGLVDWWPLDGNATNFAGDNDGAIEGCLPAENRFGEASRALFFDGQDDSVSLDTFFGGQQMPAVSYSLWFNSVGSPDQQFLSGKEGFWRTIYIRLTSANDIRFGGTSQGVYFGVSSDEQAFELDTWHHLVVTFEDAIISLFLDGIQIAQGASTANLLDYQFYAAGNSTATNYFGAIHPVSSGLTHFFNGKMDDFGLWDRALTEEEILGLYNTEPPISGCTDLTACNYNEEATSDDGSCIPSGCMETEACNYNALAECDGEACDYTCCPGPGCCGEGTNWNSLEQTCESIPCETILDPLACGPGTYWDETVNQCLPVLTCQEDLDGDGVIGINDLMQLLSSFGTMCGEPETVEFTCGDPMNYHGYDYATVQIGEQCWFAENLRTSVYLNGDSVAIVEGNSDWLALANDDSGAMAAYENTDENSSVFGNLYNGYAVLDNRKLCPFNWKVPSDSDWQDLELNLGMPTSELNSESWRGASENIGARLKVDAANLPSWNGSNTTMWSGLPGGYRHPEGGYNSLGSITLFWSQGLVDGANPLYDYLFARQLKTNQAGIKREREMALRGFSVRCLKDTE